MAPASFRAPLPVAQHRPWLSAARGPINTPIAELMEDHVLNHMPRSSKSSAEAAEDVIQIVKTYLR